jgi:hypothetical protein
MSATRKIAVSISALFLGLSAMILPAGTATADNDWTSAAPCDNDWTTPIPTPCP